tara:strand:+ start:2799 stop:3638 length:840 start_codon:yes stop_codon:yes gene_type:complete
MELTIMNDDLPKPYIYARDGSYKDTVQSIGTNKYKADYLSWSNCWDKLKELFPTAIHQMVVYYYQDKPMFGVYQPDGSLIVHCEIKYETDDGNTYAHNEYLACRDNRNNAILNPTSTDVENTYRRCLAKGVSTLTGYGINLWMGEDLQMIKKDNETFLTGNKPEKGGCTVDQQIKLERIMNDKYTRPFDSQRITDLKKKKWIGISEAETTILIADIDVGRKTNMAIWKKKTALHKLLKSVVSLTKDQKADVTKVIDSSTNMPALEGLETSLNKQKEKDV